MLFASVLLLIAANKLQAASVAQGKDTTMDVITFPVDDDMRKTDPRPAKLQAPLNNRFGDGDIHESCKQQTFCTIKPPNYPENKFNDMFKGYKIPNMPTLEVLDNRQGDPGYENGCETEVTYEPLYKVRVKRDKDEWQYVIQAPQHNFIQRVRLEKCLTTGSCFQPLVQNEPGYETSCVQMYNQWELLVETVDGNGTERVKSELPVCCSCKYKEKDLLSKFGVNPVPNSTTKRL